MSTESILTWIPSLLLGIGLSAGSGFRIFIPLLISNLAAKFGVITPSADFAWMSSNTATMVLGVACVAEVGSYYIKFIDNMLDSIAAPVAVAAGTLLTTQFIAIDEPVLKWGLGLLAGGGVAGTIHAGTGLLRLGSTKLTAGFGNGILATIENFLSFIVALISLWLPIIMGVLALISVYFLIKRLIRKRMKKKAIT